MIQDDRTRKSRISFEEECSLRKVYVKGNILMRKGSTNIPIEE